MRQAQKQPANENMHRHLFSSVYTTLILLLILGFIAACIYVSVDSLATG